MLDTIVKFTLIAIAFIFIAILIVKRFYYFRPGYEFMYPQAQFEDIVEGNVHSWLLNGDNGKVVLFCHGNAGNLSHRQDKLIAINKMGYSVLIFDYSGFGRSKGVPSEDTCYHNGCMYAELLIKKYGKQNVIVYGESLGAAVAAHVALKHNIPTLVIESGLPSIKDYIKSKMKIVGTLFGFLFNDFNTLEYLRSYRGKVLVMHCANDEIVSWDSTEEMRNRALHVVKMSGGHNSPEIPWPEIDNFIKLKTV